jgi:hypothetical protein
VRFEGTGCDGNILLACVNGAAHGRDCAALGPGYGCRELSGQFFCGLGAECVPGDGTDTSCEGTVVSFCREGLVDQRDCTQLGFTGCDIDSSISHYGCIPTLWDPIVEELEGQ